MSTVFMARPTQGAVLADEVRLALPNAAITQPKPDLVVVPQGEEPPPAVTLAFCQQCLPNASSVQEPSISTWAQHVVSKLKEGFPENAPQAFSLQVYAPGWKGGARADAIAAAIHQRCSQEARWLTRLMTPPTWDASVGMVQVVLTSEREGWVSLATPPWRKAFERVMSIQTAGQCPVPEDKLPPSRAHLKLSEALMRGPWMMLPKQTCVDLGASPGGWTYVALQKGLRVTAVDRAPLRTDLMANARLAFIKGDAFAYEPKRPVDWLICDVIATPQKNAAVLNKWVSNRWCKHFCVTIKFKGAPELKLIQDTARSLDQAGATFWMRQLDVNKNEVTAMGCVP